MNIVGKRTLITIGVLVLHQVLQANDIHIVREDLSITVDSFLLILAGVFDRLGKRREAKLKADMEMLSKANKSLVDELTKPHI